MAKFDLNKMSARGEISEIQKKTDLHGANINTSVNGH